MKIGLDIHGVIDKYSDQFKVLTNEWISLGYEVHIVTGQERAATESAVLELGIQFTHFHSIIDLHKEWETPMYTRSDKEGWWMDRETWLETKGRIAIQNAIDIHFDDQLEYAKYFPTTCTFVHVQDNFDSIFNDILRMKHATAMG